MADVPERRRRFSRPTVSREAYEQLWKESRLSLPPMIRIPAATVVAFSMGFGLGVAQGSTMTGLRFRAEHAHKLPTTTTGWYLYHKSKNYHGMFGGLKEGFKTGFKLSLITTAVFCTENLFDVYRGSKDLFNTVAASLAVAGGFSIISRFFFFLFSPPSPCHHLYSASLARHVFCLVCVCVYQPLHVYVRSVFCGRGGQNGTQGPRGWICLRRHPGPAVPGPGSAGRIRRVRTEASRKQCQRPRGARDIMCARGWVSGHVLKRLECSRSTSTPVLGYPWERRPAFSADATGCIALPSFHY